MKKFTIFTFVIFLMNIHSIALALDNSENIKFNKISNDAKILEAVRIMKNSPANESYNIILGNNQTNKIIKIKFKNLTDLGMQYKNFDALGWLKSKQLYIYINSIHKDAPPEALCALISARAFNQDKFDSLNEEIYIWALEAVEWDYFLKNNPSLNYSTALLVTNRENNINKLYKESDKDFFYITKTIKSLPAYKSLKTESPGFSNTELKFKLNQLLNFN